MNFKKTKVEVVKQKNPFPNIKVSSDAAVVYSPFVVKDNKVIAKSCNGLPNNLDPTAHAEMIAIRDAAKKLKSRYLNDYILYTTNEPCVMCVGAAVWANMKGIVFGARIKDLEDFWKKRRNPKSTRKFIYISSKVILKNCRPKMHVKGNFMREKCLKLFDLYETY